MRKCRLDIQTISIILAIVGAVIGVLGWLYKRDNKTDKDSEWKGQVNAKLDMLISLNTKVANAEGKLQDHETRICILEKEINKRSE